ncbi:MAG: class I SAM-dependent methyltransferase [Novosphingobium sp.]|nr:class I SAM-dependent methyltransferase [Novosphingobium sp.]
MTTEKTTGLLTMQAELSEISAPSWQKSAFIFAFGAIQWPWLAIALRGGSRKRKRELLERLDLPSDALPNLGSWKADCALLHLIVDAIEEHRPRRVVELGSGATSLVIARALQRHGGGHLTSFDQHAPFVEQMPDWLALQGLSAEFIHAPLTSCLPGTPGPWYSLSRLPETIDMLVIDGPPWTVHPFIRRRAEALFDRIAPGGIVMMDDANRPGERIVARTWRRDRPDFAFVHDRRGTKGTLIGRRNTDL